MTTLSIFLALLLFAACLAFSITRSKKAGKISMLEWSILGIGLIYGLGWALVIGFTSQGYNSLWSPWLTPFETHFLTLNVLTSILAFCVVIGWTTTPLLYRRMSNISSKHLSFSERSIHSYAWVILTISFILRWLYVREFGGFSSYLDHAASIRSAIFEIENKFSFLQPFGMMAIFSSFLFLSSIMKERKSFPKIIGLILSITFSIYILYSMLGRIGFLIYIFTFALSIFLYKRARPTLLIISGVFGGVLLIFWAYIISNTLDIKGASSLPEYVSRELSFPFVSFFAQLDRGEFLFRWYKDFLLSPFYLLPSSIWTQWIEDISHINTMVILGAKKGELGVTGGIPVDLLTLGLMQSSVFGVAIVGWLFGAMIRALQGLVDGISSDGLRCILEAYIAISIAVNSIAYAHPVHLIAENFGVFISIALIAALNIGRRVRIYPRQMK